MCVFCDIIKGTIPSSKIYEDEKVIAFLDLAQVTKGHTLVVPKTHYDHFIDCDSETLAYLMQTAQKLAAHIVEVTGAAGMNILSNVNEIAGQSVKHFHVHLIPRYTDADAVTIEFHESAPQDLAALAKQLQYGE